MGHPTSRAATDQTLDGLLVEAAAVDTVLPPIEDCQRLARDLRAAVRDLSDQVRTRQRRLPRGGIDWNRHDQALLAAQGTLLGGLGDGLKSAARHVSELGRRVEELREIADR